MSSFERHVAQHHAHDYTPVQQYHRYNTVEAITTTNLADATTRRTDRNFKPRELRTPILIAFSVLTLVVFVLLQISTAAFVGAPGVHSFVQRSIPSGSLSTSRSTLSPSKSPSPVPTLAPGPSKYADTRPRLSSSVSTPTPTPIAPGAPGPGSYTASFGTGFNNTVNTASLATISKWNSNFYFVGGYLPTLVAIVLGIWWKCIFARLKEMEPFYQYTASDGGAIGPNLSLSYQNAALPDVLYKSIVAKHWFSLLGSVNMVLVTLCTLLASETIFLTSVGETCKDTFDGISDGNEGCSIVLAMRPALSWTLGIILFIVFVLAIVVMVRVRRQSSGIYADPTTIAGTACLLSDDSGSLYARSFIQPTNANERESEFNYHVTASARKRHTPIAMHPAALAPFCLFLVGLLIMILYYRYVSKPGTGNAFEDFMNSQTFGLRIFMAALGLLTKFYWGWIESHMRRIRPYVALASPAGATAERSVLLSSPSHPITALFFCDTWRSLLLTTVTLMAVLSEALIISLSGIPFSPALAYLAFQLSVYISVGILVAMIISSVSVLVWVILGKANRGLPHIPESIVEVLKLLGDEGGRKALKELYDGNADSRSHMRFVLRKEAGSGVWCIKILDTV
ncbi:hypothetical protein CC80DRAFT_591485 [Byssothecium circinans]|uniref:Uncharacterized protein n=1 Tax=Byssothecium circinans TaxID=147558 RepID=A0A6A5U589_9PLEO|nr:hypothetical protein CC80DRAFT_591485 [Byssothecium circinans]